MLNGGQHIAILSDRRIYLKGYLQMLLGSYTTLPMGYLEHCFVNTKHNHHHKPNAPDTTSRSSRTLTHSLRQRKISNGRFSPPPATFGTFFLPTLFTRTTCFEDVATSPRLFSSSQSSFPLSDCKKEAKIDEKGIRSVETGEERVWNVDGCR